uniref:Uncharacterized protein n=1 Tax=Ditylum brightwellii TaxID=49249 RepID=A0A6U3W0P5_9STRA|mmetsp:Transcript_965/g.1565  ORF Transcript_965/g.1565 Transcript_965/m.1565 type:complete len:267 (+) Transcript_965:23-823(+)
MTERERMASEGSLQEVLVSENGYKVTIEDGALVCKSVTIGILAEAGTAEKFKEKREINVIISAGNIFHPGSCLLFRLPTHSDDDNDNMGDDESGTMEVVVGKNNLFEESCRVVIELDRQKEQRNEAIATCNRFAPFSNITCRSIGSANAFEPSCRVVCSAIGDGNVFAQFATYHPATSDSNSSQEEKKGSGDDDDNTISEKVIFAIHNASWENQEGRAMIHTRNHAHGIERNTTQINDMLESYRPMILKHHAIRDNGSSALQVLQP